MASAAVATSVENLSFSWTMAIFGVGIKQGQQSMAPVK
jgi:hypothetical protein